MPLPAERALRGAALLALAGLCVRAATGQRRTGPLRTTSRELAGAVRQATAQAPEQLQLRAAVLPGARERAWLRALARTGTRLRWSLANEGTGSALTVEPVRAPGGRSLVVALGVADDSLPLSDATGPLGTMRTGESGAASAVVAADGSVEGSFVGGIALAEWRERVVVRPVLVTGRASWEAKFAIAALEEAGWQVDARLVVAPGVVVAQGVPGAPDTSRYAAVVVLDSGRTPVDGALGAYVANGGGLVVAHDGVRRAELLQLAGVRAGIAVRGELGALEGAEPRRGLAVMAVRGSGVALDRRGDVVTVVARRAGAGRIVVSGYQDSWRWRMAGGDSAPREHREWWSRLVTAVAYAGVTPLETGEGFDEAPLAATVDALGPAVPFESESAGPWRPWFDGALALIALTALAGEWALRRWRGAP